MATRNQSWSNRGSCGTDFFHPVMCWCVSFNPPRIEMHREISRYIKLKFQWISNRQKKDATPSLIVSFRQLSLSSFFFLVLSSDRICQPLVVDALQLRRWTRWSCLWCNWTRLWRDRLQRPTLSGPAKVSSPPMVRTVWMVWKGILTKLYIYILLFENNSMSKKLKLKLKLTYQHLVKSVAAMLEWTSYKTLIGHLETVSKHAERTACTENIQGQSISNQGKDSFRFSLILMILNDFDYLDSFLNKPF